MQGEGPGDGSLPLSALMEQEKSRDEWSTRTGWHAQGRVCPDGGRKAGELGRQRSPFPGVGDLPPEGLAGRSGPDLCLADERLVRAEDPALRRRRENVGGRRRRVRL